MLIIPAIDLKDGSCVRLRQGLMDDATIFSDNPLEMAKKWRDQGAKRLHLVDLDGAFDGKPKNFEIIQEIAKNLPDLPIQIGGGIRNKKTIDNYLNCGVSFVIIGTKAVKEPDFIDDVCQTYPKNIIIGLDAKNGMLATDGWANVSDFKVVDLAKKFDKAQAIIYTDISRDGMMQGVNVEATLNLAKNIKTPVIASGGITNINDIKELCKITDYGVTGAITGRAIYEGTLDFAEAQRYADKVCFYKMLS